MNCGVFFENDLKDVGDGAYDVPGKFRFIEPFINGSVQSAKCKVQS